MNAANQTSEKGELHCSSDSVRHVLTRRLIEDVDEQKEKWIAYLAERIPESCNLFTREIEEHCKFDYLADHEFQDLKSLLQDEWKQATARPLQLNYHRFQLPNLQMPTASVVCQSGLLILAEIRQKQAYLRTAYFKPCCQLKMIKDKSPKAWKRTAYHRIRAFSFCEAGSFYLPESRFSCERIDWDGNLYALVRNIEFATPTQWGFESCKVSGDRYVYTRLPDWPGKNSRQQTRTPIKFRLRKRKK